MADFFVICQMAGQGGAVSGRTVNVDEGVYYDLDSNDFYVA